MESDPPDSSAFDDLWGPGATDVEAGGVPPSKPGNLTARPRREEDRATLAPPVPEPDYVRSMMELGELDDPAHQLSAAATAPTARPAASALKDEEELETTLDYPSAPPPRRRSSRPSAPPSSKGPELPIAPVPRLAHPTYVLSDLDTLQGLGPLDLEVFDHLLSLEREEALSGRQTTPTALGPREPDADLEDAAAGPSSFDQRVDDMRSLLAMANFSSALVVAESVLLADPSHAGARACVETCRAALADKYLDALGGRNGVPRVVLTAEEVRWLALDHRSGFLLSLIDGATSVEEAVDVSAMPEIEALRILYDLRTQGVIDVPAPKRRPSLR